MLGVIGLGQCGGNIANLFAERGIESLVINYSSKDLETCNNVEHKLKLVGSEGVGKQREEAIRLFSNNYSSCLEFVKQYLSQPSNELIFIVFSSAGGSGSGIAPMLSEILLNEMPDKTFVLCPVLPSKNECITAHLNTIEVLGEISELPLAVIPLDNANVSFENGIAKGYKEINQLFVDTILDIAQYTEKSSENGNFDSRDLKTLFSTSGFVSLGTTDLSKLNENGIILDELDFSKRIQNSLNKSFVTSANYEQVVRVGLIVDVQESFLKFIKPREILSVFKNEPLDVFEGYHHEKQGRLYVICTGLKFNADRLSEMQTMVNEKVNLFQSTIGTTVIKVERPALDFKTTTPQSKKALSDILNKHKRK